MHVITLSYKTMRVSAVSKVQLALVVRCLIVANRKEIFFFVHLPKGTRTSGHSMTPTGTKELDNVHAGGLMTDA